MSESDVPGQAGADDLVVLPADDQTGMALVFGGTQIDESLGDALETLPSHLAERALTQARDAGIFADSIDLSTARWVRLSDTSWRQVRELGFSEDQTGAPMGVLRRGDGRFTHVVRFDRVRRLSAGRFLTALAVREMVRDIEQELERIAEDVQALVRGSKIEIEARLATAHDVLARVHQRWEDRGHLDASDWQSLANLESTVKEAYYQTLRWLDPLREFLTDDEAGVVTQVRRLRDSHGIKDVSFWLRMHVHAELALKRWESLYIIYEAQEAPDRVADEAERIRGRVQERHGRLVDLLDLLSRYLEGEDDVTLVERLRFVNRQRLFVLRTELARVSNAYAHALRATSVEVPAYEFDPGDAGPLVDIDGLKDAMRDRASPALEAGRQRSRDAASRLRRGFDGAVERVRDRGAEAASEEERTEDDRHDDS